MEEQIFSFFIEKGELLLSENPESPIQNTLKMWIEAKESGGWDLDEIVYRFPKGAGPEDFAKESEIRNMKCHISEGWTLNIVSRQQLEKLKKEKKRGRGQERVCFLCISQDEKEYRYTFFAQAGWYFEKNPVFELELYDVMTTAEEGCAQVPCELFYDEEKCGFHTYEILKRRKGTVTIYDFYPDRGAVAAGERVFLNWKAENAEELTLYADGEGSKLDTASHGCFVSPAKSTRYRLEAKNGENTSRRETLVQVLPAFLKKFWINEEEGTVEWEVLCAGRVTIDGMDVSPKNSRSLDAFSCPGKITLTAGGMGREIVSVLYYGTEEERTDIVHFRKTVTDFGDAGFQLLHVEWKKYQVARENGVKTFRIVYQDRERNELSVIGGMDSLPDEGSWEQILTGTARGRAGELILMTMQVCVYQGTGSQDYEITI